MLFLNMMIPLPPPTTSFPNSKSVSCMNGVRGTPQNWGDYGSNASLSHLLVSLFFHKVPILVKFLQPRLNFFKSISETEYEIRGELPVSHPFKFTRRWNEMESSLLGYQLNLLVDLFTPRQMQLRVILVCLVRKSFNIPTRQSSRKQGDGE